MKYLVGASHYMHTSLPEGRCLYLFGDFHSRRGACPGDKKDQIHLADYLWRVASLHPERHYVIYLEIYKDTQLQQKTQQRGDVDTVWNRFIRQPLKNVRLVAADPRVKGIHTPMTRFLKAYSYAKFFPQEFHSLPRDIFLDHQHRFTEIVKRLGIDFDKLWLAFGFTDLFLYSFFKKEFDRLAIRDNEKVLYARLIQSLSKDRPQQSREVFASRAFASMRGHFLRIGALFVDLFVCGNLLRSAPNESLICFFGSNHYRTMKKFFSQYEALDQCQSDNETSQQNFKCLPLNVVRKNLC